MRACPKCGVEYADDVKFCLKDATELPSGAGGAVPVRGWTAVIAAVSSDGAPVAESAPKPVEKPAPAPAQSVPVRGWTEAMAVVTPESLEKAAEKPAEKPKPAEGVVPTRGWTDVMAAVTPEMVAQLTADAASQPAEDSPPPPAGASQPAVEKPKPAEGVVPTRGWTDVMAVVTPEMAAQLTADGPAATETVPEPVLAPEPPVAAPEPIATVPVAAQPADEPARAYHADAPAPQAMSGARIVLVVAGVIGGAALMVVLVWLLSRGR